MGTHRANYGFAMLTSGVAKACIRALSDKGLVVQRVVLAGSEPAIRVKPDGSVKQLGNPTRVTRGDEDFAEVHINGCAVYWEVKE